MKTSKFSKFFAVKTSEILSTDDLILSANDSNSSMIARKLNAQKIEFSHPNFWHTYWTGPAVLFIKNEMMTEVSE